MHSCIHASMHPCIHASMHPCINTSMRPTTYSCVHTSMHVYMHTCIGDLHTLHTRPYMYTLYVSLRIMSSYSYTHPNDLHERHASREWVLVKVEIGVARHMNACTHT
jgi:hypothetical protein